MLQHLSDTLRGFDQTNWQIRDKKVRNLTSLHTQHTKQYKAEQEKYSIGITFELIVKGGPGARNC